ncbi:hypothetical protein Tco_0645868 [Tanacetum coccineum]
MTLQTLSQLFYLSLSPRNEPRHYLDPSMAGLKDKGSIEFMSWRFRQHKIVLSVEDKLNYLEHPIPAAPVPAQAGQQVAPEALAAHAA